MSQQPPHVLVVDDDRYDNDRYCQLLRSVGCEIQSVVNAEQALQIILQRRFEVALVDMLLPWRMQGHMDFGGIEVLRRIKARDATTQVIAVTGYGNRELAAEAMAAGAFDYITKDLDTEDRLPGIVRIAISRAQLLRVAHQRDDQDNEVTLNIPNHLIADSAAMRQMLRRAQRLADIDGPLLIVGEPGVGKELIARVIHINSRYAHGPFVVVPCRSLSSNLVELWGDIEQATAGFCAQAERGTLVLKGIQDLPFNQQKQLVNFINHKTYQPIGTKEVVTGNLRIIATTTGDLERLVRQGRFWRSLYDVLSVATLDVPPLRERRDKDDITAIAGYLLHRYGLASGITPEAAELLVAYDYVQGNVKELEEVLRKAATHARGGSIEPDHLPPPLHPTKTKTLPHELLPTTTDNVDLSVRFVPGDADVLIWESQVGGSTRSRFDLPFAEAELPLVLRALDAVQWPDYPEHGPQFSAAEQMQLAQFGLWDGARVVADVDRRIGQMLYRALMADSGARSALDGARNSATDKGQPFALLLRFPPDAIALAALPWELLWDERQPLLLSRTKLSSCVRYIDLAQALPPVPATGKTLRLLAIRPSKGIPDELHAAEHASLVGALEPLTQAGQLVIEELHPVKKSSLTDRLQDGAPVDIVHFFGHGAWVDGSAYLQFDDGRLSANQLATLLGDIPLVVLHACRSGKVGTNDLFTGIAPMLSAEGVAAVVAMQFTVGVEAANRFAVVFYRNLAKGGRSRLQ